MVKYKFTDVETMPDTFEEGVVYNCYNERAIYLKCTCGCGDLITLSSLENNKPCWNIINYNTIHPSIQRTVGCMSHFSIQNGEVVKH